MHQIDQETAVADFSFYDAAYLHNGKDILKLLRDDAVNPNKMEYVLGDEVMKALQSLSQPFREIIYLLRDIGFVDLSCKGVRLNFEVVE